MFGPSSPSAPSSSSFACAVVLVEPEETAVVLPVADAVLSSAPLSARPRATITAADRAERLSWLMVMVLPLGKAVTL
jgi:hypothetical protein